MHILKRQTLKETELWFFKACLGWSWEMCPLWQHLALQIAKLCTTPKGITFHNSLFGIVDAMASLGNLNSPTVRALRYSATYFIFSLNTHTERNTKMHTPSLWNNCPVLCRYKHITTNLSWHQRKWQKTVVDRWSWPWCQKGKMHFTEMCIVFTAN